MKLILTCEHASNRIPARFKTEFANASDAIISHRGWDPGSVEVGKIFAQTLGGPLLMTNATRLLVEPNRSLGHRHLFSDWTRGLDPSVKQAILNEFYFPHRNGVESWVAKQIANWQTVLHLSIHTFVPEFDGELRNADVGLLYDPQRSLERKFCAEWRTEFGKLRPELRVRMNYPYRGNADGFTTFLRKQFPADRYLGIELEVNQRHLKSRPFWRTLARDLADSSAIAKASS